MKQQQEKELTEQGERDERILCLQLHSFVEYCQCSPHDVQASVPMMPGDISIAFRGRGLFI